MKSSFAAAILVGCSIVCSPAEAGRPVRAHVGPGFPPLPKASARLAEARVAREGGSRTIFAPQPAPARSVWDGAYTLAQAKRGALKSGLCIHCHGDEFRGDPAPGLAGPDFLMRWDGRTVGDLFEVIRLTMPDDDPGAMAREEYADLVAYILALNKFPTGSIEIGIDAAPLKQIQILATKP
jgi:mono/diheme cytochrome c family protein